MGQDWLSILQQQAKEFLDPDEHLLAAFQAQPRGTGVARAPAGGVLAQAATGAIGQKWAKGSREAAAGAGLELVSPMVLGLSERRLLVLTGKKKSLGTGKIMEVDQLISSVSLELTAVADAVEIAAIVRTTGQTGVEMEALTAASVAALTVYDMCKSVDRGMRIEGLRLTHKAGGKSGEFSQQ